MKRIALYLTLLTVIIHIFTPYTSSNIDKQFIHYEQTYMRIVKEYCTPDQYFYPEHTVEFSNLPNDTIGICYRYPNRYLIQIDQEYWDKMSYDDRLQLYFHEATHCLFGAEHTEDGNNYMYYRQIDLPKEILFDQLKDFLKKQCQI